MLDVMWLAVLLHRLPGSERFRGRVFVQEKGVQLLPSIQRQRLLGGEIPDVFAVSPTETDPGVSSQGTLEAPTANAPTAVHTPSGNVSLLAGPSPLIKNRSHLGYKFAGDTTQPTGHGWPSILHVQSPLFGNLAPQAPSTNGPAAKRSAKTTIDDGPSPVLGRRLRYEPNWDSTIGIYS